MDEATCDLLKKWKLSNYIERFEAERIDIATMQLLSNEDIKKMFPKIGDRARFEAMLRSNQPKDIMNNTFSSSLFDEVLGGEISGSLINIDPTPPFKEPDSNQGSLVDNILIIPLDSSETRNNIFDLPEIFLCWKCKALIQKFVKFKRKLQHNHNVLQQMTQHNSLHDIDHSQSMYQQKVLFNINFNPDHTLSEGFHIISDQYMTTADTIKEEISDFDIDENNLFSDVILLETTNNIDETIDKSQPKQKVYNELAGTKEKVSIIRKSLREKSSEKVKRIKSLKRNCKYKTSKEVLFKEVLLNEEEVANERSLLSKDSNYVNAMYKCESCIESFPNSDDMKDHMDSKHNPNNERKCQICQCTFASCLSFSYHSNRHTVRFQCRRCAQRFITKSKVAKHFAEYHSGGRAMGYGCLVCQLEFSTEIELCIHKRTPQHTTAASLETPPVAAMHSCKLCDKTFKWRTSLNKHMEKHRIASGLKRRPFCELCSLTFTHSASLTKHVKTSSKHQELLKERNAKEGESVESASVRERQHACPLCDKRFQWKGNLQRHMSSHAARAAGELVCVPCNRTFSSIATYKQHMKISRKHVSVDDYQHKCAQCDAKFVSKSKLKDHIDWEHLKNYVHECDTCKKVFKSHTSLYLHKQVVHVKEGANHLCDHCGKSFPHVGKLRSHISALHSEHAPYKCHVCGTTFNWHSCLSRHLKLVHKQTVSRVSV